MFEKALFVVIFMYAFSFSFFIVQFTIGDVIHVQMTSPSGQPLTPAILNKTNLDQINTNLLNIQNAQFDNIASAAISALNVAWNLIQLMTGSYGFTILALLGVPDIVIMALSIVYWFLFGRMIIAYIRGI